MGCQEDVLIEERYYPKDDHKTYQESLQELGLIHTEMYKRWIIASNKALINPVTIKPPFQEIILFSDIDPAAYGYRFDLKRGERLTINLERLNGDDGLLFLDLFEVSQDSTNRLKHIASQDTVNHDIDIEVSTDMSVLLCIQPELLISSLNRLLITKSSSLEFPVAGRGKEAIGSLFGVPRDAGRRVHEGIDIFARRHTPIISVSDGHVNFAGHREGSLGGNVIWVKDEKRDLSIYYAHLQDVLVQEDEYVLRGDTIGTIGNSGNAKTTSPHLHFGIYQNGAVDPYAYVVSPRTKPTAILSDTSIISDHMRVSGLDWGNRNIYSRTMKPVMQNDDYCLVVGATSTYYKVQDAKGEITYVFYDNIDNLDRPLKRLSVHNDTPLLIAADKSSAYSKMLTSIDEIKILAYYNGYSYCELPDKRQGWLAPQEVVN